MNRLPRFAVGIALAVAAALLAAGSHLKLPRMMGGMSVSAAAQDQAAPDQGPDPAAVNEAPSGPSYTTEAPPPPEQAGAPGQGSGRFRICRAANGNGGPTAATAARLSAATGAGR